MQPDKNQRYENLDYLRGLCALSIMAYHYIGWTVGGQDAGTILGKFGVYGVSMFYVLSGLTMYLVYFNKFGLNSVFFRDFYVKRLFRIYPLMWFIMLLAIVAYHPPLSVKELFLNFSGLFSIFDWDATLPLGVWSIGNELSFYLMLPLFFYCLKKGNAATAAISIVIFAFYFYIAFVAFDRSQPVGDQDSLYKNPLNQAGLFLGGILVGHFFKKVPFSNTFVLALLLASFTVFYFYPVDGNAINLITGIERVVYTILCFVIAFGFLKADLFFIPQQLKKSLSWLGEISYSLYLIHGHVFTLLSLTGMKIRFVFPLAVVLTFVTSWLVYRLFESPARNLGARLAKANAESPVTKNY